MSQTSAPPSSTWSVVLSPGPTRPVTAGGTTPDGSTSTDGTSSVILSATPTKKSQTLSNTINYIFQASGFGHTNTAIPPSLPRPTGSSSSVTMVHQAGGITNPSSTPPISAFTPQALFTTSYPSVVASLPLLPTTPSRPSLGLPETHELIIEVGACAGVGAPTILMFDTDNYSKLTSLGNGKFKFVMEAWLSYNIYTYTAEVFLEDDGSRCGQTGHCTTVLITFDNGNGISMTIRRSGDRGLAMYPLSIWMDEAITWDTQPANTLDTASHCWGWTRDECPNAYTDNTDPPWTISSRSPTARAFVSFCPPGGPAFSSIGTNPNPPNIAPSGLDTLILILTDEIIPTSTFVSAYAVAATITAHATEIGDSPIQSTYNSYAHTPASTPANGGSTPLTLQSAQSGQTFAMPSPSRMGLETRNSLFTTEATDPAGSVTLTAIGPSSVLSTQSEFIAHQTSSVIGVVSDSTTTILPSPDYIVTSWTTWTKVDGSTIPAIVGQVGVLATVSATYVLQPGTIVPIGVLSSLSAESARTATYFSPTSTVVRDETATTNRSIFTGVAIVSFVGFTLGCLLVWLICYKQKRGRIRSKDHRAQGCLRWGVGRKRRSLDLDGGTREREVDREMVVEPWVTLVSITGRKEAETLSSGVGSTEIPSLSGYNTAGPSRESAPGSAAPGLTSSHSHFRLPNGQSRPTSGAQSRKAAQTHFHSEPQPPSHPRLQPQPPARSVESDLVQRHNQSAALLPTPPEATPEATPSGRPPRQLARNLRECNAIPPLYNEAWKTVR